jgi:hypothetical protein
LRHAVSHGSAARLAGGGARAGDPARSRGSRAAAAAHTPLLREGLAAQAPLRETFQSLSPAIVDERALAHFGDPRRLCFSVNRAEDLDTAERWLVRGEDVAGM